MMNCPDTLENGEFVSRFVRSSKDFRKVVLDGEHPVRSRVFIDKRGSLSVYRLDGYEENEILDQGNQTMKDGRSIYGYASFGHDVIFQPKFARICHLKYNVDNEPMCHVDMEGFPEYSDGTKSIYLEIGALLAESASFTQCPL